MIRRFRFKTDIIVATALLVSSSAVCIYGYATVRDGERSQQIILPSITRGEQRFIIRSGARCAGTLLSRFVESDGSHALSITGSLQASYGQRLFDLSLLLEAFFNPLMQLSRSALTVTANDFSVTARTISPHPITLELSSTGNGPIFKHSTIFPGPIMLARNSDDTFRIMYPLLGLAQKNSVRVAGGLLIQNLSLSIEPTEMQEPACPSEQMHPLDLLPLVARVQQLALPLTNIVGSHEVE